MYTQHTMLQQQAILPDHLSTQSSHADAQGQMVEDLSPSQQHFVDVSRAAGDFGHFDATGDNWISTLPGGSFGPAFPTSPVPAEGARAISGGRAASSSRTSSASSGLPMPVLGIGGLVLAGLAYLAWKRFG